MGRTGPILADVAKQAGVSLFTASRVINDAFGVSESSTTAVRKAMEKLGYVPPPLRQRRGPRSRLRHLNPVGQSICLFLVGTRNLTTIVEQAHVYTYVIHGIENIASSLQMHLQIRHVSDLNEAVEVLRSSKAIGSIFFGSEPAGPLPREINRGSCVWVMGTIADFPGDHLLPNHTMIGKLAATYLFDAGCQHCAVIATDMSSPSASGPSGSDRVNAFCLTLRSRGGTAIPLLDSRLLMEPPDADEDHRIGQLIDQFCQLTLRPTGLFVFMDALLPSVYRHLVRRGIEPGRDVTVVGANNERPYLRGLYPQPAEIDICADYIGGRAVERLLWRLKNPDAPSEKIVISPQLVLSPVNGAKS